MDELVKNGDVVLLAGYRRHGKDTFYRHLAGEDSTYDYDVRLGVAPVKFPVGTYRRIAFADILKEECARFLGITVDYIEEHKDGPLPAGVQYYFNGPPGNGVSFTMRDVLIDYGRRKRADNVNYFVDCVINEIRDNTDCITIITDWRFTNEFKRIQTFFADTSRQIIPARIFRYDAPFPPADEESEHQLDSFNFQLEIRTA